MGGKDPWPLIGQNASINTQEHGTVLLVEMKAMLERVQTKKETLPKDIAEHLLQTMIDYLIRTKNQITQSDVLGAIDKLSTTVGRNHEKIDENTTAMRKTIADFSASSSPLSSSSLASKASTRSWASIASYGGVPIARPIIKSSFE